MRFKKFDVIGFSYLCIAMVIVVAPLGSLATAFFSDANRVYATVGQTDLTVSAASDLQFAFEEIGEEFTKQTGQKVAFNFGSTGQLSRQIENGAPVDVFAAANKKAILDLEKKGLVDSETITEYAEGKIVLAGKPGRFSPKSMEDLSNVNIKKIAIANPLHAPYGLAAQEALISAGLWDQIQEKIVITNSVREVLAHIQTGNVELGILAYSLVRDQNLSYIPIDIGLYKPIRQSMVILSNSKQKLEAKKFIDFLNSSNGVKILKKYGYIIKGES